MFLVPYQLPTQTYAAGSRTNITLKELPKTLQGLHCHLAKIQFDVVSFTPTFAANDVPTVNAHQIFDIELNDGNGVTRFKGNLNALRAKERLQTGRHRIPDADEGATTAARHFSRVLHIGPPQMVNYPSDFVIHTGALENGQISINHSALAAIDADLSALTATLRVTAWLMLLPEIRVPPAYQFLQEDVAAKSHQMTGRCRYESIALLNSSSYDAISAGDFAGIRLDFGRGDVIPTIDAEALRVGFLDDFAAGEIGGVLGEPETATDDNSRQGNRAAASVTALVATAADLQPVFWTRPGGKLNKLFDAESVAKLTWNGSQSGATVLYGRFLAQPPAVVAALAAKAVNAAGVRPGPLSVKTLSKQPPKPGMNGEFLPWKMKAL